MKHAICKHGETKSGTASITLERQGPTLVFKSVPAEVYENCSEQYTDPETIAG